MNIDSGKAKELIPEMLDRLHDHCQWCADCDWTGNPDVSCRFGELWNSLRKNEIAKFKDKKAFKFAGEHREHVVSVEHLGKLAEERRSVYIENQGRFPASVVLNWQGSILLKLLAAGKIFIWQKPQKAEDLLPKFKMAIYNHCMLCDVRNAFKCGFPDNPAKDCGYGKLIIEERKLTEVRKNG